MRTAVTALVLVMLALAGCSAQGDPPREDASSLVDEHDLAGLDVRQVIERLDTMPLADRPTDLMASVRPDVLVLSDDDRQTELAMPQDEVYVAFAPYLEQTHECHFHSLTTCVGELGNAAVTLEIVDADGEVVLSGTRTTFENGFVGAWVPRDTELTVTIGHRDRSATRTISTQRDDDATCVTTMRLV